jgi:hypothetical protein
MVSKLIIIVSLPKLDNALGLASGTGAGVRSELSRLLLFSSLSGSNNDAKGFKLELLELFELLEII